MSLINDALKRATQAQGSSLPTLEPGVPMRPVPRRSPVGLPGYFTPVLLFVLSGACWFMVRGWDARRQAGNYPDPIIIQAREIPAAETTAAAVSIPEGRNFALGDSPSSALASVGIASPTATESTTSSTTASEATTATAAATTSTAAAVTSTSAATAEVDQTAAAEALESTRPVDHPAPIKLQAIFYRTKNPAAVVNSKTVYVGDTIDDITVRGIGPGNVTLEVAGQTKVLTLK